MLPCPLKRKTACISYPTSHSFLKTLLSNDEKEDGDDAEPYKCSVLQTIIEEQKITAVSVEDVKHAQMKTTEHPKKLDSLHWGLSIKSGRNYSAGHEVKAMYVIDRQNGILPTPGMDLLVMIHISTNDTASEGTVQIIEGFKDLRKELKKRKFWLIFSEIFPAPRMREDIQQKVREINVWLGKWCKAEFIGILTIFYGKRGSRTTSISVEERPVFCVTSNHVARRALN
ncbi:uncharacterized protein LOC122460849 [Dermochelys coriacea]|uniref:uncharacterized protein LOC122460849 n=1 Tax=Dermochelys coriacea TaxID=27794 RepID=UPI001CA97738|nr:uncharacterized protein LOC122460849 [Dermochelys coriacea]